MAGQFSVNGFVMHTGERYCLIVNRSIGLPVYYPNLYITTQVRNDSLAYATMEAAASNLVVLLYFLERRSINLEQRLLRKEFLRMYELDDLRDFTQRKVRKMPASVSMDSSWTPKELEFSAETVSNGTHYARLSTIAD